MTWVSGWESLLFLGGAGVCINSVMFTTVGAESVWLQSKDAYYSHSSTGPGEGPNLWWVRGRGFV